MAELKTWNLHHPAVKHTYMFASKNLHTDMGTCLRRPISKSPCAR